MHAPVPLVQITERFHHNAAAYRSGYYNETQVRREFIDPLFRTLGWDIENEQGAPEKLFKIFFVSSSSGQSIYSVAISNDRF